jgi:thiamine-monophosphate kinase
MVSGIHFLPEFPPEDLGWKSLATNISDIASMGGLPTMALVTLAIPACLNLEWLLGWYRGMGECARTYNVNVCGGDIVRTLQDVAITVSLSGEVEAERMVTRSGVCVGDRLIVTGCLGDSAGGLALHQAGVPGFASLLKTHLQPQPRVTEARLASCSCQVHGMLDLSDGLGGDLRHLCEASGVGARVDSASIPISAELRRAAIHLKQSALQFAIRGGEDYELLLAVSPASVQPTLDAIASAGRISGTVIGTILPASAGVLLITEDGAEWELDRSFTHF